MTDKKLKIAVQMDPIADINPAGDSSFAMMLAAQQRGHEVHYYTPATLSLENNVVKAEVASVKLFDDADHWFELGEAALTDLSQFDVILLRQDPPFDMHYITTTHMLERLHPKTLVVNHPDHVRNAPEKNPRH